MNHSIQHEFEPEEVMAYLDGELDPRRAAALAAHLDHCTECQSLATSLRQVADQLTAWEVGPVQGPSAEILARLLQEQSSVKSPAGTSPPQRTLTLAEWIRMRPVTWAFACIIVALLIVGRMTLHAPRPNTQVARLAQEEASRGRNLTRYAGGGGGG